MLFHVSVLENKQFIIIFCLFAASKLYFSNMVARWYGLKYLKQECIPVGYGLSAAVVVGGGGVSAHGQVSARWLGVSAWEWRGFCSGVGSVCQGVGSVCPVHAGIHPLPREQNHRHLWKHYLVFSDFWWRVVLEFPSRTCANIIGWTCWGSPQKILMDLYTKTSVTDLPYRDQIPLRKTRFRSFEGKPYTFTR